MTLRHQLPHGAKLPEIPISAERAASAKKPWASIPPRGPIFRPSAAAAYVGLGLSTFYELVKLGELPPLLKLSNRARASGVPQCWLDAVIAAKAPEVSESVASKEERP